MNINSPLSGSSNIKHIRSIIPQTLIDKYKKKLNIDVSSYLNSINRVDVYEDVETGYRFYYPFDLSGDDHFYRQLQQFDWYYMPWKWEHMKSATYVNENFKVLEIGCAKGDFLQKLKSEYKADVVGLELNQEALKEGISKELQIYPDPIQEHAQHNEYKYDVVCAFQVLEHISNVSSFIQASIKCARKGGKIIFSVPNNHSFSKYDEKNDILNMPPHHMGLWNKKAFISLQDIFDIKLHEIAFEPLQPYHVDWYIDVLERRLLPNKIFRKIYDNLNIRSLLEKRILKRRETIKGHTILAVFEKK